MQLIKLGILISSLAFSLSSFSQDFKCHLNIDTMKSDPSGETLKIKEKFFLKVVPANTNYSPDDNQIETTKLVDNGLIGSTRVGVTIVQENAGMFMRLESLSGVSQVSTTDGTEKMTDKELTYSGSMLLTTVPIVAGKGTAVYRSIGSNSVYIISCGIV